MNRVSRALLGSLLLLLLGATNVLAQATAQINGTVADSSGGVLPGVTVTAIQTETGIRREVVTDETGSFVLTNLPVGPYRLEAALSLQDLAALRGNRLEALKGDRKGQHSIRINEQWRVCFEWPGGSPGPLNVEIADYH